MAVRLGELLVESGMITELQLKEALHAQTVFGGRLGTNLVELGYVNEIDLAKLLSAQLNIPWVDAAEFENIDPDVLKLVPARLIKQHRVVPLSVEGKTLRLAMADPSNFPVVDEMRFATGLNIEPVVAPEILLVYAAERYYDIPREMRYIRAAGMEQNLSQTSTTASAMDSRIQDADLQPVVARSKQSRAGPSDDEARVEGFPIHQTVIELARGRRPEDVLEVIRSMVAQDFKHLAVFLLKGETAVGAAQHGCKLSNAEFAEFSFPVNASELMSKIWTTQEPYVGEPTLSGVDNWVFSELGIPRRRPVLIMPIVAHGAIVCVFIASENKKGELLDMMDNYNLFARKVGLAFELVTLVNQILDLSELDAPEIAVEAQEAEEADQSPGDAV